MKLSNKALSIAFALSVMSQTSNAALLNIGLGVNLNVGTADPANAVALGEMSSADTLGVSIGRAAGAGSKGLSSIYIGGNTGTNSMGRYNTVVGDQLGRFLEGSGNSLFGAGIENCLDFLANGTCGNESLVKGNLNTLLGNSSNVEVIGDRNLSVGFRTGSVEGFDNISIGTDSGPGSRIGNLFLGNDFLNIAKSVPVKATETISIGTSAQAATTGSIAIGSNVRIRSDVNDAENMSGSGSSIAIGNASTVQGVNGRTSIAIGTHSSALDTIDSIAFGTYAKVTADNAVALGAFSEANIANTISVGNDRLKREILNVAAGTTDYSAVNLSQVRSLISQITLPPVNLMPTEPVQMGTASVEGLVIEPTRTSVGINASASVDSNSVALGNGSVALEQNVVSVGDAETGLTRRITNVADGVLFNDAATVGQVNNLLNTFAINLPVLYPNLLIDNGGGDIFIPVQPSEPVVIPDVDVNGNTNITNVASGGSNNTTVGNNAGAGNSGNGNVFVGNESGGQTGKTTNGVAIGNGAKAGTNAVAIGVGSVASDNTVSVGSVGNERQIKNVAAGTDATDAANVQQLNDGLNAVAKSSNDNYRALDSKIDRSISNVRKELKEIGKRAYGGTALALAMGNHSETLPNGAQVQIGVGSFNGESAIALSTSMASESGTVFSLGGGVTTQGDIGVRAGISFSWDPEWTR